MNYRKLGSTGFSVSEVGIGGEYLEDESRETTVDTMHAAMDMGVNILDIFMSEPNIRTNLGLGIKDRRDKIYVQGHICSVWENGQYGRSRDLEKSKFFIDDLFTRLDSDYIDIGMLHYIDEMEDWQNAQKNGIVDYMLELKKQGRFRTLGVSSHDPVVAHEMISSGVFEVLMFSINPMFDLVLNQVGTIDYMEHPELGNLDHISIDTNRAKLYSLCEEKNVGITVMKTLGAGRLLKAESSPFKVPMTVNQCIHYALARPAVASVLIGARSVAEIEEAVRYCEATDEQKDYSAIFKHLSGERDGACMYCNHCLPCPVHIDVAATTRILDEARQHGMTDSVRGEYAALAHKASECISCGACEKRCPFTVKVIKNMKEATALFE
ncbi:MAG: aldo/keto reductase [Christensenella sp.]|uniref:aldo/keto reductase n=1 Tax=Christensenella sp. TaxID=1935934 RepID=UPI002B2023EF|nr:aldo/keto reductase [Christensenella sp.]MEA5002841.1 aldo/keto reductase [Christensenella sp.]